MKIGDNGEVGRKNGLSIKENELRAKNSAANKAEKKASNTEDSATVSISKVIDFTSTDSARSEKIAALKKLVQSGDYFKEKNIFEIAQSVSEGLDEEVSLLQAVGGDTQEDVQDILFNK